MKKYLTVKGNFYSSVLTSRSERQFFHRRLILGEEWESNLFWSAKYFGRLNIKAGLD